MKPIAGILAAAAVLLALRYAASYGFKSMVTAASTNQAACLVMVGNTTREEKGFTYIVGSIRNDCERKVDHVTIDFKSRRSTDSNFGPSETSVFAYNNNLQPGETQPFKTAFSIGKNVIYRYDGMTAF